MSSTPRLPSPPRVAHRGQNAVIGTGNNGNDSPPNDLHLIDSLSDINLNAAPAHFARFLSARNSLELHRNRPRRPAFDGNFRSLPTFFSPEEYETLREHEDEGIIGSLTEETPDSGQVSGGQSPGRSVDWPDLHSSRGERVLQEFHSAVPSPTPRIPAMSINEKQQHSPSSSVPSTDEENSADEMAMSASSSPPLISLMTRVLPESSAVSIDPFQDKFAAALKLNEYPFDTTGFPGSEFSGIPLVPGSVPVMAYGQSPVESRSLERVVESHETTATEIINAHDGLDLSTQSNLNECDRNIPRAAYLEQPEPEHDIFGKMVEYNTLSTCHSPINGQYCNLPYDYYSSLAQPKSIPVYYNEDNQQSQIQYSNDEKPPYDTAAEIVERLVWSVVESLVDMYIMSRPNEGSKWNIMRKVMDPQNWFHSLGGGDAKGLFGWGERPIAYPHCSYVYPLRQFKLDDIGEDDELLEDEKPPVLLAARDLPTPDPLYVFQNVGPSLRPLIIKNCKKDCRSWLWKSSRQREARLAQQREEEQNGMMGSMNNPGGTGGGRPGQTSPYSRNANERPCLGFFIDDMTLGSE